MGRLGHRRRRWDAVVNSSCAKFVSYIDKHLITLHNNVLFVLFIFHYWYPYCIRYMLYFSCRLKHDHIISLRSLQLFLCTPLPPQPYRLFSRIGAAKHDVAAVDQDPAGAGVEEAEHQPRDRGFAGARWPYNCNDLTGFDYQRKILDCWGRGG